MTRENLKSLKYGDRVIYHSLYGEETGTVILVDEIMVLVEFDTRPFGLSKRSFCSPEYLTIIENQ
jgi:hypothetical protein